MAVKVKNKKTKSTPVRKPRKAAAKTKPAAKKRATTKSTGRQPYEATGLEAPGKGKPAPPKKGKIANPFEKGTVQHKVATLLLTKGWHSMEDIKKAAGGSLSPRTFGLIIVMLERQGARFDRVREVDADSGSRISWYNLDPTAEVLGKHSGNAAAGVRSDSGAKKAASKKAASKTKTKATAKKAAPKRSGRKSVAKKVARKKR